MNYFVNFFKKQENKQPGKPSLVKKTNDAISIVAEDYQHLDELINALINQAKNGGGEVILSVKAAMHYFLIAEQEIKTVPVQSITYPHPTPLIVRVEEAILAALQGKMTQPKLTNLGRARSIASTQGLFANAEFRAAVDLDHARQMCLDARQKQAQAQFSTTAEPQIERAIKRFRL